MLVVKEKCDFIISHEHDFENFMSKAQIHNFPPKYL